MNLLDLPAEKRVGAKGTYSGFPATVIRHYVDTMYEIRVPGGITCVTARDIVIAEPSEKGAPR